MTFPEGLPEALSEGTRFERPMCTRVGTAKTTWLALRNDVLYPAFTGEEFCFTDKLAVPQCHGSGNSLRLLDRVNNPSVLTISCHALQDPPEGSNRQSKPSVLGKYTTEQGEVHHPISWHCSLVPLIGTATCYRRLVLLLGTLSLFFACSRLLRPRFKSQAEYQPLECRASAFGIVSGIWGEKGRKPEWERE